MDAGPKRSLDQDLYTRNVQGALALSLAKLREHGTVSEAEAASLVLLGDSFDQPSLRTAVAQWLDGVRASLVAKFPRLAMIRSVWTCGEGIAGWLINCALKLSSQSGELAKSLRWRKSLQLSNPQCSLINSAVSRWSRSTRPSIRCEVLNHAAPAGPACGNLGLRPACRAARGCLTAIGRSTRKAHHTGRAS